MTSARVARVLLLLCCLKLPSPIVARRPGRHPYETGSRELHPDGLDELPAGASSLLQATGSAHGCWQPRYLTTFKASASCAVACMVCCVTLWKVLAKLLVTLQASSPAEGAALQAAAKHPQAGRMPALDGLRAIFMVHVLLFHQDIWTRGLEYTPSQWTWLAVPKGVSDLVLAEIPYGAMQFFFALSGFNLYAQMVRRDDSTLRFFLKRWARITPLYYTALLWMLAVAVILPHMRVPLGGWVLDVFYFQGLWPVRGCSGPYSGTHDWIPYGNMGPCWFLSALMICSCAVPLVRVVLSRSGPKVTTLLLVLTVYGRTCMGFHHFANTSGNFLYTSPITRSGEFLAGVFTAHLCMQLQEWHPKLILALSNGVVFDLSITLVGVAGFYSHTHLGVWDNGEDVLMTGPFCLAIMAAWAAAQCVAEAKAAQGRGDFVSKWGVPGLTPALLSAKPMVMFGDYSYSAFLFQYPVTMTSGLVLRESGGGTLQDLWFVPQLMSWVVGITLTHCVEEPIVRAAMQDLKATQVGGSPSPLPPPIAFHAPAAPENSWTRAFISLLPKPGLLQGKT